MTRSTAIAVLLAVIAPTVAGAAPLTFEAPLPLEEAQVAVGSRVSLIEAPGGPAPERAHERVLSIAAIAMATLFPRTTLAVTMPYVDRRVEARGPAGDAITRGVRGAGDVTASLALTAVDRRGPGGRLLAVPFLALKTPTGFSDDKDELGRLPQRLQVGTGAVDAAGGALVAWQGSALEIDGAVSYLLRTEAHQFDAGDELRTEVSARRALATRGRGGTGRRLLGALEGRVVWQAADTGALAPSRSGGIHGYLCPGLQADLGPHTIDAAVEFPLVQPVDQHVAVAARLGYRILLDR